jgi:hypothetical protein
VDHAAQHGPSGAVGGSLEVEVQQGCQWTPDRTEASRHQRRKPHGVGRCQALVLPRSGAANRPAGPQDSVARHASPVRATRAMALLRSSELRSPDVGATFLARGGAR